MTRKSLKRTWVTCVVVIQIVVTTVPGHAVVQLCPLTNGAEPAANRGVVREEISVTRSVSSSLDPVLWREYLRCFPDGSLAQEARTIVAAADQRERSREAAQILAEHLARESTLKQREASADDETWKGAVNRGTLAAMQAYLERYPAGRHAAEANVQLASLDERQREERQRHDESVAWNTTKQDGTREAFETYAASYPNGAHVEEATKRLAAFELEAVSHAEEAREGDGWKSTPAGDAKSIDRASEDAQRRRAEAEARATELRRAAVARAKEAEQRDAARRLEVERKAEEVRLAARARAEEDERAAALLAADLAEWNRVKDSDSPRDFRRYLTEFPNGRFTKLAGEAADALERVAEAQRRAHSMTQNKLHGGGR